MNREFQTFKLDLEKAEEPEIKLPTSAGSLKKQKSSRKTSVSALLTMSKALTVCIRINWKILKEMGIPNYLTCLLRNLYAGQKATVRTGRGRRVLIGRSGRAPWRAPSPSTHTKPLKELSYLRRPLQPLLAPPQGLRTPHFISKASQNIA